MPPTTLVQTSKDVTHQVSVVSGQEERGEGLTNMHIELEKCERALTEYLDMKKNVFPR